MKKLITLIVFTTLLAACSSKPVLNLEQVNVPSSTNGTAQSLKSVQEAIFNGALRKGWTPRLIKDGLIQADIAVRSHDASVEITYTESTYSINYKDSHNLNYNGKTIHRNYNRWVNNLSQSIQQELGVNAQKY